MAALPHSFSIGIAAESDAVADGPNPHQAIRAASRDREPGCHRVGIVHRLQRRHNPLRLEDGSQRFGDIRTL